MKKPLECVLPVYTHSENAIVSKQNTAHCPSQQEWADGLFLLTARSSDEVLSHHYYRQRNV
jgi:hypothetical protein